jgi:hypothetical protein
MPIKRTTEHFKYRNRAVRQATYLNPYDKVVLIAIAEFAHDDGIFWHGFRTIARAAGVSVGQAYKSIQNFITDGVLVLVTKGKPGYSKVTSTYQIVLDKIPEHPSIYDLVKNHPQTAEGEDPARSPDERTETVDTSVDGPVDTTEVFARSPHERTEPNRSPYERTNGARSPHERQSFTPRTEGVDFDVDLPPDVDSNTGGDGSAASPPCGAPSNLKEGQSPNPSQSQTRVGVHGQGAHGKKAEEARRVVYAPKWKPAAFEEGERKSNPNPKTNGNMATPRSADPPIVANNLGEDCAYCFSPHGQQHHKNCFVVTGVLA